MLVGGERLGQTALPHDDERDAVRQPPLFVAAVAVEPEGALVQLPGERDYLDARVVFERLEQLSRRPAIPQLGQGVAESPARPRAS